MTEVRDSVILRVISGVGGVLVFVAALILSVGAAVAAPVGMFWVRRWTARRQRQPSRIASVVGAVFACSIAAAVLWGLLFTLAPHPTTQELRSAMAREHEQQTTRLPGWYTRIFPQAARTDSVTQQLVQSPGFITVTLAFGFVLLALFFGAVGGTLGWCGATLLAAAWARPSPQDAIP